MHSRGTRLSRSAALRAAVPFLAALSFAVVGACGSSAPFVWVTELPASDPRMTDTLRPGDKVQVAVRGQDTLSGEFEVRPGGVIVLPVAGAVPAAGRTLQDVTNEVTRRFQGALADPVVTIVLASRGPVSVGVIGEVRTPGRYDLAEREGVLHALARAGGLSPFANENAIFVVRPEQGQRIRFRYSDLTAAQGASMRFRLTTGDVIVVE